MHHYEYLDEYLGECLGEYLGEYLDEYLDEYLEIRLLRSRNLPLGVNASTIPSKQSIIGER